MKKLHSSSGDPNPWLRLIWILTLLFVTHLIVENPPDIKQMFLNLTDSLVTAYIVSLSNK